MGSHLRDDKFLIHCAARSGSTMLVHLLNSHPRIRCHDEPFGAPKVGNIVGRVARARKAEPSWEEPLARMRERDVVRFVYDLLFDAADVEAVGFKFKADESLQRRHRRVTRALRADTDIKVCHLRRRNLLAQYVSHRIVVEQTGVTLSRQGDARPEIRPLTLEPARAVRAIRAIERRFSRSASLFASHRSHSVDYEDLGDPEVHAGLCEFLGVEPRPLSTPTQKIVDRPLASLVTNFDQVCAALAAAGWGDRCG